MCRIFASFSDKLIKTEHEHDDVKLK
jgi:hypothetical protein